MVEAQENIDRGGMVKRFFRDYSEVNEDGSGGLEEEETDTSRDRT